MFFPHCVFMELLIFSDANASLPSTQSSSRAQRRMSGSPDVRLMCADSDVRASECKLISDWGILCVRRDCFLLHAVIWFQGVSAALLPSVCVCLWVVMHVAMQFPCLSGMCFCLWE